MDITKISIKRPVAIMMVMFIIIILGAVSITKMEMELTPETEMSMVMIMTTYEDAGPEEVENLVTEKIESAVANVENVESISSTSSEGSSMVSIEFNYGTNLDTAITDLRDKLSMVEATLPDGCDSPNIMKMDMNSMPIATIVVSGEDMTSDELKSFAEDDIEPRLERQEGVASVDIMGGTEQEILIEIDPERLEGLGLTMTSIGQILSAENSNQSGGSISYGEKSMTISTKLQMESIEDVKNTPIQIANGTVMRLGDIATVTETQKEVTSISRYNGESCVTLSVTQSSDGNTVTAVNNILDEVEKLNAEYPDMTIEVVSESGSTIEDSVMNVVSNIFTGAILSILVMFVFLKNVGLTGVIAVSMPISIIGTFVFLYFSGTTLNMISLGGLSVGVGMLVDNSVVMLENIYRYRTSLGYGKVKGTYRAGREVRSSLIASTLTTIVAFIPFVFVSGMMMQMMTDLALAIVFSLAMSLISAMTVVPMLAGNYVNNVHRNKAPKKLDFINKMLNMFDIGMKKLSNLYGRFLKWAVWHKKRTLSCVMLVFIASLCMLPSVGMELMPSSDEGTFSVTVKAPKGSNLDTVDALSLQVEEILEQIPEMVSISVTMSGSSGSIMGSSEESSISCVLVDKNERDRSTDEIVEEVRNSVKNIAGAEISVSSSSSMGSMMGGGVSVEIYGDDMDKLQEISDQIASQMEQIEGVRQVSSSLEDQDTEVALQIDKERARQYGLTGSDIASQVRNTVSGFTATTLKANGTEMDIRIVFPDESMSTLSDINDLSIMTGDGKVIPLSSVAEITMENVPSSISRDDQSRYVTISCDVYGRDSGSIGNDIQAIIDQMTIPDGYSVKLGGTNEMMNDTFSSLGLVIVLAIVLVYMVMAAQFESFVNPFIIMFTIPLAFTGAIFLLFITGEPLSMMALIGCLVLVGIVVNNGIVLIDYIDILCNRDGYSLVDAILTACPTRLRPILMTALTTILGQFPMIFSNGTNSETLKGMGLVIAGGLTTSTFLTLVVVPLLYMILDRFVQAFRNKMKFTKKANPYEIEQECC